jgi:hypothetical protein
MVGVFEYHGWVTIQDTTGDEGLDDDPSPATLDAIRAAIIDSDLRHRVSLDERNVSWFLTIHGLNNHAIRTLSSSSRPSLASPQGRTGSSSPKTTKPAEGLRGDPT